MTDATNDRDAADFPQNPLDLDDEYADRANRPPHIFTANYIYELPFFRDSGGLLARSSAAGRSPASPHVVRRADSASFDRQHQRRTPRHAPTRSATHSPIFPAMLRVASTGSTRRHSRRRPTAPTERRPRAVPLAGRAPDGSALSKNFYPDDKRLQFRADLINAFNHTQFTTINARAATPRPARHASSRAAASGRSRGRETRAKSSSGSGLLGTDPSRVIVRRGVTHRDASFFANAMIHVLGIDAGGTKTVCQLADAHGQVLAEARRGGANLQAVGRAARSRRSCTRSWRRRSASATSSPAAICLGIAGVDRPDDAAVVRGDHEAHRLQGARARRQRRAGRARGRRAGAPGVVIIAGTGSIAYGRNARSEAARAGGWGYMLGDEGSGYWIGRAALRAVLRDADRRGPATALTRLLLAPLRRRPRRRS